jgi:hypothetical protein
MSCIINGVSSFVNVFGGEKIVNRLELDLKVFNPMESLKQKT